LPLLKFQPSYFSVTQLYIPLYTECCCQSLKLHSGMSHLNIKPPNAHHCNHQAISVANTVIPIVFVTECDEGLQAIA